MSKPVLHRPTKTGQDWFPWFEFKGERYEVRRQAPGRPQSDGYGYMIVRVSDLTVVDEGFAYLSEIRDLLARAYEEDWPSLEEDAPPSYGAIEQSPEPPMSETHRAQKAALDRYAAHHDTMPSLGVIRPAHGHGPFVGTPMGEACAGCGKLKDRI